MNVAFPLRDGYFRALHCTRDDQARWKELVCDLVQLSLEEERPFLASQYQSVNAKRWKPLKERGQLRVFQPRRSFVGNATGCAQSVLAVGTIEGTLEDVVYGVHHLTTQDMRVTTSFLNDDALDSAVLHVFENGIADDPFRSLALKWRVVETPGGALVKNRDGCVLEYKGISHDGQGQRYAFHVAESFDHPVCPPFNTRCAIRAKAHTRIVYRQISPGVVGVYFRGDFNMGGRIPGTLARRSAAEIALSVGKSVQCAEAKKLTALALSQSPIFHNRNLPGRMSSSAACSICTSRAHYIRKSMTWCKVCGSPVCSKCRSRKYLLSDEKKIRVSCCKQCIVAARDLPVDPQRPIPLISAGQWLARMGSHQNSTSLTRSFGLGDSQSQPAVSPSSAGFSVDIFDDLLTPLSMTDYTTDAYEEPIVMLEQADEMELVEEEEEEEDIPTLQEAPEPSRRKRPRFDIFPASSDAAPQFARSAFTPAVAKRESQAAIHHDARRVSLYTQMRSLRERAEDVYSMTRANGWEFLGPKPSTSSSSRSTAVMSSSSSSTAWSNPSIGDASASVGPASNLEFRTET